MAPDDELLRRVQARDERAFEELFARHAERVRRRIAGMVRDAPAAEDLMQECFLRLWTRAAQWTGRGSVGGWLLRTATNLALNHQRTAQRQRLRYDDLPVDALAPAGDANGGRAHALAAGPLEALAADERASRVREAVNGLPPAQREVWQLVHEEEMELRAVAEELGLPLGTVKSRLHYGTRALAERLGRDGFGEGD